MGRIGSKKHRRGRRNDKRNRESMRKQSMLNAGRITPFKYDMNVILETAAMDESAASSLLASVIAKGTRCSTKEAKDFVRENRDVLTDDEVDRICKLIDRYSRYR